MPVTDYLLPPDQCPSCAYLDRLLTMNPSDSLVRTVAEVRAKHEADDHPPAS